MKFLSKEIAISDEELGFTLTFYERKSDPIAESKMTIKQLMDLKGEYLLIQKTYAEDDFETDYFYFETNDPEKSGQLNFYTIDLYKNRLLMSFGNELFEINFIIDDQEFEKIQKALKTLTHNKGNLIIHDH